MENQGYEEEPVALPFGRQYTTQSSSTPAEGPRSSSTPRGIRGIASRHFRSEPEAHVYEDIAVSGLEDAIPSGRPFGLPANSINNNNNINNINNNKNNNFSNELTSLDSSHWSKIARRTIDDVNDAEHFHVTNEPTSLTSSEAEVPGNFHRNRTLPLSSGARVFGEAAKSASSRFSVRVTNRERSGCPMAIEGLRELRESPLGSSSRVAVIDETTSATNGGIDRPGAGRRRRKKDCKHCKSKTNSAGANRELLSTTAADTTGESATRGDDDDNDDSAAASTFPVDAGRVQTAENNEFIGRDEKPSSRLGLEPIFALPDGKLPSFNSARTAGQQQQQQQPLTCPADPRGNSIFAITNNTGNSRACNAKTHDYEKNEADLLRLGPVELSDDRALITPQKNRVNGMKVNSIYSHDHWHQWGDHKDAPIFVTDVKEQSPFQRAYSLPTRTQTPSSQNRANLRRSVRGEPPPHPAQLRKNRHGWTLHFARPLDGTGCTRSIVLLLIAILALLGIGGIALYIVFEPEKLQIIQQYLRSSSTPNVSTVSNDTFDDGPMGLEVGATETTMLPAAGVHFTESLSAFAQDTTVYPKTETEAVPTTSPAPSDLNATRHCDDCYDAEVCVALVDEEVPFCRIGPDPLDPTGCAGLCLINKQKCHRLDVDAFRCVEVEHYCLDDEWTCSNTLCIPLVKHCDGHMNCYDHSDEYDCACDLQTHFQCGNETSCLPLERRCDGKIDCWDATDEINCTLACPSSGDFTCSNGECILKARFCDGLQDCKDGSDEPHGCQGRCNKHEFSCHNGRCITKAMKCNGIDDCDDGSDEQHCRDRI